MSAEASKPRRVDVSEQWVNRDGKEIKERRFPLEGLMNFRPKSFTISLPPRAFYSNGRTTYRLPDSPGHKFAYLDGHLFKLLVDELVITQHADGVTTFGAVQVQVIGQRSKANIMHHNAHLRALPKRPSGQASGARDGHAGEQDGTADNPLAQAISMVPGRRPLSMRRMSLGCWQVARCLWRG